MSFTMTSIIESKTKDNDEIFTRNPYESQPSLSPLEAEVLWEYAKLAQHIKNVCVIIRPSASLTNLVIVDHQNSTIE